MSEMAETEATTTGPTLLDRAIQYVSPERALRRSEARIRLNISAAAHKGADMTRRQLISMVTTRGDADADNLRDLPTLRANSREFERNNPLALGAINTVTTNVVGTGLKVQSNIDRAVLRNMTPDQLDAWEENTEREFNLWAESQDCDAARTLVFADHQDLAFRQALVNGDHIVTMPRIPRKASPYTLALMHVEADRLSNADGKADTNRLVAGVEKDQNGAPIKYHIADQHPGARRNKSTRTWTKVPAFGEKTGLRNVIHLYKMTRAGQTRGIPYLSPVIETLRQLDKYTEAELMAAVVTAMLTVFIKTEEGEADVDIDDTKAETGAKSADDDIKLGVGAIVGLAEGESIETVNPLRPNSGFDPFVVSILRQVGVALELPFEVLIKHFTASYSASRAAIMEAWKFFKSRRAWLVRNFCQIVYETWLYEAVAIGRISAPGFFADPLIRKAYCGATWRGDGPLQIDPVKEVVAAEKRIVATLSTVGEETVVITGGSHDQNFRRLVREVTMYQKAGLVHPATVGAQQTAPPAAPDGDDDNNDNDTEKRDEEEK